MKREFIMIAIVMAVLAAVTLTMSAGPSNQLTELREKIITTQPGKYPALVRIVTYDGRTMCSGTVITKNLVLTAAHCIASQYGVNEEIAIESLPNENSERILFAVQVLNFNQRADYALLSGDFKQFSTMPVETDPEKDVLFNQSDLVSCGFPYGAGPVCYPILTKVRKMYEAFGAEGQMYPAMSGGPVIDLKTGKIVGVNKAIGVNEVYFSPLIGLFEMARGR